MGSDFEGRVAGLVREAHADPRTADELVSAALTAPDEEARWEAVTVLHRRGVRECFEAARALCRSGCALERELGANILGQLGVPERAFPGEAVAELAALLKPPGEDAAVLRAALVGLGHHHDPSLIGPAAALATHPSTDVRFGVAFALATHDDPLALGTLIRLTEDADEVVRDWATFALGRQTDADTRELREALVRAATDVDEVVRGEALVGLARRQDGRVVVPLVRELEAFASAEYGSYAVEAAEELADPRLLPALLRLQALAPDGRFDRAIARCTAPTGSNS